MTKKPTARQIEAYRLVKIRGLTHQSAAEQMEVDRKTVTYLLSALRKVHPELFDDIEKNASRNKMLSYDESMAYDVVKKY